MKDRSGFKQIRQATGGNLFSLVLFLVIMAAFLGGLQQASAAREEEAKRIARDSLVRAAVSCYAIEGRYPESYEYLKENYGVIIDEEKYAVHYSVFASNIMPDISITEK